MSASIITANIIRQAVGAPLELDSLQAISTGGKNCTPQSKVHAGILSALNSREDLYMSGGMLARVERAHIQLIDPDRIQPLLAEHFTFHDKQDHLMTYAPHSIAKQATQLPYTLPDVVGIVKHQTMTPAGRVLDVEGYDVETKLLFTDLPVTSSLPEGEAGADLAALALFEPFKEFPSCAIPGIISCILTGVMRPTIGLAPMHMFNAPAPGSGKSLAAELCALLVDGTAEMRDPKKNEEEFEKTFRAALTANPAGTLVFDNVQGRVDYGILKAVLTARSMSFRILGTHTEWSGAVSPWVIMTGNNAELGEELIRRSIEVSIDTGLAMPAARTGFTRSEDDVRSFVLRYRGLLLSSALRCLQDPTAAEQMLRPIGSFTTWAKVVARATAATVKRLQRIGLLPAELEADVTPKPEAMTAAEPALGAAWFALHQQFDSQSFGWADVNKGTREALDELLGSVKLDARSMGHRARRHRDRPVRYEDIELMLTKASKNGKWQMKSRAPG